jgi:signal-transduction protein with cAMP-binding, CBS, and nucleotidyltransferase domain
MTWNDIKQWIKSLLNKRKELEYLTHFPILDGFTRHELFLFSQIVQDRQFKQGEFVYREQYPLAVIFLIGKGSVEVREDNAKPLILKKNQFIGIVDMYNENRRKGEARTLRDSTLYAISHLDFQAFIKINPRTGVKLLNNICLALCRDLQIDDETQPE